MRLRKFYRYSCFLLGLAGAVAALAGGVLMALGYGWANYAHMASFVLTGAMLLFLGTMEKGEDRRGVRRKLLALFLLLVLGNLGLPQRLPPLDILEIAVLPCLAALYRKKGDGIWIAALAVMEVSYVGVRYLGYAGMLGSGGQALRAIGITLCVVAAVRFAVLLRLYLRMKTEMQAQAKSEGAGGLG